ncbi:MAG TPA: SDR family NAD(P)-dependent oxidoreductase [Dehalococcoidia bacterium]|nr:SDR family NAD(P)-dependent oxidoreductase [Dehalococcoidia bacterium]
MVLERFALTGKVAIVTGAGRGLGREMALALAKAGAHVVAAARTQAQIEATASQVQAMGGGQRALALQTDVRDSRQVDRLIARCLDEFGRVDIMLSNAGIGESWGAGKALGDFADDDWRMSIDLNLSSVFYCARAASRPMIEQGGGVIINLSSGTALRGFPQNMAYNAAKAGVLSLTKSLAMMLARHNIRVNCIVPGFVAQAPAATPEEAEQRRQRGRFVPVQRLGEAWELGPLAVFLASDASSYLTGQGIAIDGGGLAGGYAPVGFAPDVSIA